MAKGLKLKVAFNFSIPHYCLTTFLLCGSGLMKVIGFDNKVPIFVVMGIYTIIYSIFAVIAYNHSKERLITQFKSIFI